MGSFRIWFACLAKKVFGFKDVFAVLLEFSIAVSHLGKKLFDLPHGSDLFDFFSLTFEERLGDELDFILLVSRVRVVLNAASTGKSVMHLQLLFEVSDFSLVLFEQTLWILQLVNDGLVLHLHHPGSKLQS